MTNGRSVVASWLLVIVSGCGGTGEEPGVERQSAQLAVNRTDYGTDNTLTSAEQVSITYCVSHDFGAKHARVVREMAAAASEWEKRAYVKYVYVPEQDSGCVMGNANVLIAVRPTDQNGAFAPTPDTMRAHTSNELIINLAYYDGLDRTSDKRTSQGVLKHELGHTLGFAHEHAFAPEPIEGCRQTPGDERQLTDYDRWSIMHYRSCLSPPQDYFFTDVDATAAYGIYPAPARCEIWEGGSMLQQFTLSARSMLDAQSSCEGAVIWQYETGGKILLGTERRADALRAIVGSLDLRDVAIYGTYQVRINDRASVVNGATGRSDALTVVARNNSPWSSSRIGADASVGPVHVAGALEIADRAHVHGPVVASPLARASTAIIDGHEMSRDVGLSLPIPSPSPGTYGNDSIEIPNNHPGYTLAPGSYLTVTVRAGATLHLSTGSYGFFMFIVEPGATVRLHTASGPIRAYVEQYLGYQGRIVDEDLTEVGDFLMHVGTGNCKYGADCPVEVNSAFYGTLVTGGRLNLNASGVTHTGAFFGGKVEMHQASRLSWHPFRHAW